MLRSLGHYLRATKTVPLRHRVQSGREDGENRPGASSSDPRQLSRLQCGRTRESLSVWLEASATEASLRLFSAAFQAQV